MSRLNGIFGFSLDIAMLIGDGSVHMDVRCAAVGALLRLVAVEQIERSEVIACLKEQFHKVDRRPSPVWEELVWAAEMLSASELTLECIGVWEEDLVSQDWDVIKSSLNEDREYLIENLRNRYERTARA